MSGLGLAACSQARRACCCRATLARPVCSISFWLAIQFLILLGPASLQLGKGDVREARAVGNRLLGLGIGAGAALAALFWLAEPVIPSIFSSDAGGCMAA